MWKELMQRMNPEQENKVLSAEQQARLKVVTNKMLLYFGRLDDLARWFYPGQEQAATLPAIPIMLGAHINGDFFHLDQGLPGVYRNDDEARGIEFYPASKKSRQIVALSTGSAGSIGCDLIQIRHITIPQDGSEMTDTCAVLHRESGQILFRSQIPTIPDPDVMLGAMNSIVNGCFMHPSEAYASLVRLPPFDTPLPR